VTAGAAISTDALVGVICQTGDRFEIIRNNDLSVIEEGVEAMRIGLGKKAIVGVYVLLLTLVSSRPYFYSLYDMDMMGYIANAIAMTGTSAKEIHATAYRAVVLEAPDMVKDHLLGRDMAGPPIHPPPNFILHTGVTKMSLDGYPFDSGDHNL
jgi:hypothetical protein